MEEAVEACYVEYAAQKARKKTEAKTKEEAKRQRIAKREEKRKTLEYIQQLWDEVIVEDATLLKGTVRSQVAGSKYKEVTSRDKEVYWPFKKAKGKYHRGDVVKIGGANSCERYMCIRQNCLVHHLR